jgi:major membrane immunogen (membrane-anchored lipoprotein)
MTNTIKVLLIFVISSFLFFGCSNSKEVVPLDSEEFFVGNWKLSGYGMRLDDKSDFFTSEKQFANNFDDVNFIFSFNADKTVNIEGEIFKYTYDSKNKLLTFSSDDNDYETIKIEIKDNEFYYFEFKQNLTEAIKADVDSDGYEVYEYFLELFSDNKIASTSLEKAKKVESFYKFKRK